MPLAENSFFIKTGTLNNFKNGDKVEAEVLDKFYNTFKKETCVIYGFNDNIVLVKSTSDFYTVRLDKVKK